MNAMNSVALPIDRLREALQQTRDRHGGKPQFLRLPDVKRMTALSRASVYKRMKAKSFPQAIRLGARFTVWIDLEVQAWIQQQIATSRAC